MPMLPVLGRSCDAIYVSSKRAAARILEHMTKWIEKHLKVYFVVKTTPR